MSKIELSWYASGIIGDKMYAASQVLKKIFVIDLKSKCVQILRDIDCYYYFKEMHAIREAIVYEDAVYFMGMHGTGYLKYVSTNGKSSGLIIDREEYKADYVKLDECNIIVSSIQPWKKVWKLNLSSGKYTEMMIDSSLIKRTSIYEKSVAHHSALCNNKIYYPTIAGDNVAILDLEKNRFEIIRLEGYKLFGVINYQDKIIFSLYGSSDLLSYNVNTNEIEKIVLGDDKEINKNETAYSRIAVVDSKIVLLPSNINRKIGLYDIEKKHLDLVDYPENFKLNKKSKYLSAFFEINEYNGKIIISQLSSNMMLELDPNKLEVKGFQISSDVLKRDILEIMDYSGLMYEEIEIGVDTFVDSI